MNNLKSRYLPKAVHNYILSTGNRVSQIKIDLYEETKKVFPDYAVMNTEPAEGELLRMLVKLSGGKRGIEVGTFTGYSALCMAEALPKDGKLICFDISEEFTNLAKKYWKLAGLDHLVELRIKGGLDGLSELKAEKQNIESFDFAYVDADKPNYLNYHELLLSLIKPNGFIVYDNTLWGDRVVDDNVNDEETSSFKKLNLFLHNDKRVEINMLGISDGVTIVRKI